MYYYLLSAAGGLLDYILVFFYFRRKIRQRLYYRLGHTETSKRLAPKSPLGKYVFSGLEKHISSVWRFMNVILPLAGLASIVCGIVGFELKNRIIALTGLVLSGDLILLSLWLMLLDALFFHLDKKIQLELQKFSIVVFFAMPFLIFSLKLFG